MKPITPPRSQILQPDYLARKFATKHFGGDGCWLWNGQIGKRGYGMIGVPKRYGPRIQYAHRVSWRLHRGEIPDGLSVLHRCDNPKCVNPDHLFLGTAGDNIRDCVAKGRQRNQNTGRTHCRNSHQLTPDNVRLEGGRFRRCLACQRNYQQKYREERTAA